MKIPNRRHWSIFAEWLTSPSIELTFNWKRLGDCRTLEDYDIQDESTLYLSVNSGNMDMPISVTNALTISEKGSLKWFGDFDGLCDCIIGLKLPFAKWHLPAVVQNFINLKKFISDGTLQTEHWTSKELRLMW